MDKYVRKKVTGIMKGVVVLVEEVLEDVMEEVVKKGRNMRGMWWKK